MSKDNYAELVEGIYVEPGHDVYDPDRDGPLEPPQSDAEPSEHIARLEATIRTLRSSLVAALKKPAQSDAERSRQIGRKRRKRLEKIEAGEEE